MLQQNVKVFTKERCKGTRFSVYMCVMNLSVCVGRYWSTGACDRDGMSKVTLS